MKRKLYLILTVLLVSMHVTYGQTNTDTPNLSFEDGSFTNWRAYTGQYFYDEDTNSPTYGSFTYRWTPITGSSDRVKIVSNNSATYDPVIACNLLTNPTNQSVARIGRPNICESWLGGSPYLKYSAAEKIEYSFEVTANTTLFSYKLAAVLHTPPGDNHLGEQRPSYFMEITVTDDNGTTYTLPCSSYSTIATSGSGLIRNSNCQASIGGNSTRRQEFFYQPWISGNVNLLQHIGKTVTISIITHDCLLDTSTQHDVAGNHSAHGYFWAETKRIELNTFSCENADATIVAPTGFSSYTWSRSDGKPIAGVNAAQPHIAVIEQSQNLENVKYFCEMNDLSSSCGSITVSTIINHVKITPDFANFAVDAGKIQFMDNSTAVGDTISNYYWDFGDGSYSALKNP